MARIAGIMQPTYLPWIGYLEMIDRSDVFVIFDDVQFAPKSWQQRNRIKGPQGELLLTVPVLTSERRFQRIYDVEVDSRQTWAAKHLRSIQLSYARTPYLKEHLPSLTAIYGTTWTSLRDLNVALIRFLCDATGIRTPLVLSSELPCRDGKEERIIDICRAVGADCLYDTQGAEHIIDVAAINAAGIQVCFQRYQHPTYRQQHGPFLPYMSGLDLLLNEGPASIRLMRTGTVEDEEEPV